MFLFRLRINIYIRIGLYNNVRDNYKRQSFSGDKEIVYFCRTTDNNPVEASDTIGIEYLTF